MNSKEKNILLTGCTEIPAEEIGKLFYNMKVICTEFNYDNNKISGIKKDTFGNLKLKYIHKKSSDHFTYFTDDPKTESELMKIMDKNIVVDKNDK